MTIIMAKKLLVVALTAACGAATLPATPAAAAAGDCYQYNYAKCQRVWYNYQYMYSSFEECAERETEIGNCPPGSTRADARPSLTFASYSQRK